MAGNVMRRERERTHLYVRPTDLVEARGSGAERPRLVQTQCP